MLNPVTFASLDELDAAVVIDPTLIQTSGTRRVYIAGTSYRVDFENSSVSTESSSFVVRSREQWQATELPDAPMELRIARVMFSPRQEGPQQEEPQQEEPQPEQPQQQKGKRKKTKFKPLDLWSKPADDVAGEMERLNLDEGNKPPRASVHRLAIRKELFQTPLQQRWLLAPDDFKAYVATLDLQELIELGKCLRTPKIAFPLKVLFAEKALSFAPEAFTTLDTDQMASLLRPFIDADAHSHELLTRIGNRVQQILSQEQADGTLIEHLHVIYKCMVQVGFQHRCMMPMARYFSGQPLASMAFSPEYVLNTIRCMVMDHVLVSQSARHRQAQELKRLLLIMYEQLPTFFSSFQPQNRHLNMFHWINLYGRYILGLDIDTGRSPPDSRARESAFQRRVEEMLKSRLPEVPFENEKRLPDIGLDVDFYCEPRIIIEVQGHNMHFSANVDALAYNEPDPWDRRIHSTAVYPIRTSTLLKQKLLHAAGYTVFALASSNHRRIDWIVESVRRIRSRSERHEPAKVPSPLVPQKITLLRRPESSPATTAPPPEAPSTSAPHVTAPASSQKVILLRRPQPAQAALQIAQPSSPTTMLDPTASHFVPRVYQSGLQQQPQPQQPQPQQQHQPQLQSYPQPYPQPYQQQQPYPQLQQQAQPQMPTMPPPGFPLPPIPAPPSVDLPPGMQLVLGPDGLWHCVPVNPPHWPPPH